ncbi:MAG: hypothetical protein E7472_01085 [Ruminococcaceae bacterium]|nr:hypothetical protein [Oscillospiraceae bacterium]
MKNTLKINHIDRTITMDRTFAKNAENTRSEEYAHLQSVRRDYPTYTVVRRQIKKNPNKESWKGLTYEYMENYISTHEEGEARIAVLKEFAEKRLISECHSECHRYPTIKKWFLEKYPEIAEFGMTAPAAENSKVVDLPQQTAEDAA